MSVPTQQRRTVVTDWRQQYLDFTADERALVGTSAWHLGWAEGRAFGLREERGPGFLEEVIDEVVFRIFQNAGTRVLAQDLARSVSLTELNERRYGGASPQRLAELRMTAAEELRRVRLRRIDAAGWAA